MKLYLAGPMRGIIEFNHPEFRRVTAALRAAGHEVFSPAEHNEHVGLRTEGLAGDQSAVEAEFPIRRLLGDDLAWICAQGEGVALLKGWEHSKGACAEAATGKALGLPVGIWTEFI